MNTLFSVRYQLMVVACGLMFLCGTALASEQSCAAHRTRSAGIERAAELTIRNLVNDQGSVQLLDHNDPHNRPLPDMSPIDYKRSWAKTRLRSISAIGDEKALFFTVHDQRRPSRDAEVLNLPFDVYWCLAAKGDVVLLSDEFTHHYTAIAAIDYQNDTIDLIDRWPDVLTQFYGTAPEAVIPKSGLTQGTKLVRFTRNDFARLFLAAVTLDTPEFVNVLKKAVPPDGWTPELQIALGRSLIYAGKDKTFPDAAADLIAEGIHDAGVAGKQDLVKASVPAMFVSVALAHAYLISVGEEARAKKARNYRDAIEQRFGSEPVQRLSDDDALLIAAVSAAAKDWETAKFFFDQAISKDPRDYRAYLGRSVLVSSQIAVGANADRQVIAQGRNDASMVLELIEAREREFGKRRSELAQKTGVYWQRGVSAEEEDAAELGDMKSDRVKALEERGRFHLLLRNFEDAKSDGEKLIELAPDNPKGYEIAGTTEIFLGEEALGRANLERAHSMRTGGGRK